MSRIAGLGDALVIVCDPGLETCLNVAVPTGTAHARQVGVTGDRLHLRDRLQGAFVRGICNYFDVKSSQMVWS